MRHKRIAGAMVALAGASAILPACTYAPRGELALRRRALAEGKLYKEAFAKRRLPRLGRHPTLHAMITRALLANGTLENDYWHWLVAIEQIPRDGTQASTLSLSAGTTINQGNVAWDSTTLGGLNDPMTDIYWPAKITNAARRAYQLAIAAGRMFQADRYRLRAKIIAAWYAYNRAYFLGRIDKRDVGLLKMIGTIGSARFSAGRGGQAAYLRDASAVDVARNGLLARAAQRVGALATLNALLDRGPKRPLPLPKHMPGAAGFAFNDARIVGLLGRHTPLLAGIRHKLLARRLSLTLAKLAYYPNFDAAAGTDLAGLTQSISGVVTVPLFRYKAINAAIRQARDAIRAQRAALRQTRVDLAARLVADLAIIHDADRQLRLIKGTLLPQAKQIVSAEQSGYAQGRSGFTGLLQTQQSLLKLEKMRIDLMAQRADRAADVEAALARRLKRKGAGKSR